TMNTKQHHSAIRVSLLFLAILLLTLMGRHDVADTHTNTGEATGLETIVITPLRYAETADRSLSSVSVITRKDIERNQPKDVLQALAGVPGVTITHSGGYGTLASV